MSLTFDLDRVFAFVGPRTGERRSDGMAGLGVERGGAIVAGALYERFNGVSVSVHFAIEPGVVDRVFARAMFRYPFDQLGCKRLLGWIEARNVGAMRLAAHAGFRPEHRIRGVASDGGDVILHVMARADCRPLRDASMARSVDSKGALHGLV